MKTVIVLLVLCALAYAGNYCGGTCPSSDCPSCPCGTHEKVIHYHEMSHYLSDAGFKGSDLSNMLCICQCESGNDTNAVNYNTNSSWDTGLCQINDANWKGSGGVCHAFVHKQSDLCAAKTNAKCAYTLWQVQGFAPWSADARCGCQVSGKEEWSKYKMMNGLN